MTEKEKQFIELYSFKQKKYPEIEIEMKISRNEARQLYSKLRSELKEIQKIRDKFRDERRKDFNNDFRAFYDWYIAQGKKCAYCGITQEELNYIFTEKKLLPLNNAKKRSSGTLEIERKDSSSNTYDEENIVLACPLCNNAKSNLIDETNWKNLFVPAIKKYYAMLLKDHAKEG